MKILGSDLTVGIKKAQGVVDESSVIEHLRGFKFNPRDNKVVEIAGSDGKITLLARIPYQETESTGILSISSEIIEKLVKYIEPTSYVEFEYSDDERQVTITSDNFKLVTEKKEFENEQINFDIFNETEFDDELDIKEFSDILSTMSNLIENDYFDVERETIFMDGEKAYIRNGEIACKTNYKTNKGYLINSRQAKQILIILNNSNSKKVKLKHIEEENQVIVKTDTDILSYFVYYTDFMDMEFMDEYKVDTSFSLNKNDFIRAVYRTSVASEEDEIYLYTTKEFIGLETFKDDGGESAQDAVEVKYDKGMGEKEYRLEARYMNLVSIASVAKTKDIKVTIDSENSTLVVEDNDKKIKCLMSVNIE